MKLIFDKSVQGRTGVLPGQSDIKEKFELDPSLLRSEPLDLCQLSELDVVRHFIWDQTKLANRHWLAANMSGEAFLGFTAFNNRKLTGVDVIDFVKYRQLLARGETLDEALFEQVLALPKAEDES